MESAESAPILPRLKKRGRGTTRSVVEGERRFLGERQNASAGIGERVPAPFEQRQGIGREGAEIVDQPGRGDARLNGRAPADEIFQALGEGDLRVVDALEAARRALERRFLRERQAL